FFFFRGEDGLRGFHVTGVQTCALPIYGLGAAVVPMYEAQRPDDWEFILRDCEAKVVFGRTPEIVAALEEMRPRLPALQHVIFIEGDATAPRTIAALEVQGRATPIGPQVIVTGDLDRKSTRLSSSH